MLFTKMLRDLGYEPYWGFLSGFVFIILHMCYWYVRRIEPRASDTYWAWTAFILGPLYILVAVVREAMRSAKS